MKQKKRTFKDVKSEKKEKGKGANMDYARNMMTRLAQLRIKAER